MNDGDGVIVIFLALLLGGGLAVISVGDML